MAERAAKLRRSSLLWPALIATVAAASAILNVAIALSYGIPKPGVHDEFAYLLMADTFSSGRLSNPTHPEWPHFETYHVFQHPTYQAKYPPGQGAFLALGQSIGGMPVLGVWLSLSLACAATCWMLGGLVPRGWAFLGGLLLAANPHVIGWWGQSYWGGAVAALGGALVFGAAFRLHERRRVMDALLLAVGVVLLANTRPFEGLFACLAAAPLVLLAVMRWRRESEGAEWLRGFVLPLGVVLCCAAAWTLYYNAQLTGDIFRLPYLNWHPEASEVESLRSYKGPARLSVWTKLGRLSDFFMAPPLLFIALLGSRAILKDWRTRFCLLVLLLVAVAGARFTDAFPHYLAPFTCLVLAVLIQGLRSLAGITLRGRPLGRICIGVVLIACFAWDGLYLRQLLVDGPLKGSLPSPRHWDAVFEAPAEVRQMMIEKLESQPRKDLVLVGQDPTRYVDRFEWVYNAADIDAAEVVWARDLGEAGNASLLEHFKKRRVWLLDPLAMPLGLSRLP